MNIITIRSFIHFQQTVKVVVVDNAAGSDLLYCNNDPH